MMRSLLLLCAVLITVITLGDCAAKALRPVTGGEHKPLKPGAYRADRK